MDAEAAVSAALGALDAEALARDAADAVRIPSVTGDERPVLEALAALAAEQGLEPDLHRHDLAALRAHPGHPGEEVPRDELWGLTATLAGGARGRLCVNGHVDVVGAGTVPWRRGPWSGALEDGRLHGGQHVLGSVFGFASENLDFGLVLLSLTDVPRDF